MVSVERRSRSEPVKHLLPDGGRGLPRASAAGRRRSAEVLMVRSPAHPRIRSVAASVLCVLALTTPAPAADPTPTKQPAGIQGSREGLLEAWIAADAAVVGTYRGVDSTRGPVYHRLEVEEVWMGRPERGLLHFKAPRGMRGEPGARSLLFFWDQLAGAPDGFLEESKARYGEQVAVKIGPDSLCSYLLPFPRWSYPFEKNKLVLRGQSAFLTEIPLAKLREELLQQEEQLQPANVYKRADVVMRAQVKRVVQQPRVEYGAVVERRVYASFQRLDTIKGAAPDTLGMRYLSVPRSPRFDSGEEVILFLTRGAEGLFLAQGKRAVLHVEHGTVLEAGKPLAAFLAELRGN